MKKLNAATLSHTLQALICLGVLALASSPAAAERARLPLHQVDNWKAVSDMEIIIEGARNRKYLVTTFSPCIGLRTTETLAFITSVGSSLDAFSSVALPNGTRCYFKTFVEVPQESDLPLQNENIELGSEG